MRLLMTISIARFFPSKRARRCVPPAPGMMPMVISGCPNFALSEATIISHEMANSHPPPKAQPDTAAMTTFFMPRMRSHFSTRPWLIISNGLDSAISLISAPAAKAFSFPVTIIAPTFGSLSKASSASKSSVSINVLNAFIACGRFRVTMPTRPRISVKTVV